MAGSPTYTDEEIIWVLNRVLTRTRPADIQMGFANRFGRKLTGPQLRYLKTKYGRDPRFNSPLVNRTSGSSLFPPSTRALGAVSAPSPFPAVRPSESVAQQQAFPPLAGARRPREPEEMETEQAPKRRRASDENLATLTAVECAEAKQTHAQRMPVSQDTWMPEDSEAAKMNGNIPGDADGYRRTAISLSRMADAISQQALIDLTAEGSPPSSAIGNEQIKNTNSCALYTAGKEMAYSRSALSKNAGISTDARSDKKTPPSGILPIPESMASYFIDSPTSKANGHDAKGRRQNGSHVYSDGFDAYSTSRGGIVPAKYSTSKPYSPLSGIGGGASNGFNLPNLNQSPGSDNGVGYDRTEYVNRDALIPNSSGYGRRVADRAANVLDSDSGIAFQVPTKRAGPARSTAAAAPYNQQILNTLYSPELFNQNYACQETTGTGPMVEPYFSSYAFEPLPVKKQPQTEGALQHGLEVRQQYGQREVAATQGPFVQQRFEDEKQQQDLDQRMMFMPQHVEHERNALLSAAQLPSEINPSINFSGQQLQAPVSGPEKKYVLDQEIVFPNVADAAAAIASVADLFDGVPIQGPVWDWFDNQPLNPPVEADMVYGGWGPVNLVDPFVVPVQPQASMQTNSPQEQQTTPAVPYLAEPTVEEVIGQLDFDWQLPAPEADFNAADYDPAHPFADGLAGGLAQPAHDNGAGDPLLTQLIEAAYREIEAEAAAAAAAKAAAGEAAVDGAPAAGPESQGPESQ